MGKLALYLRTLHSVAKNADQLRGKLSAYLAPKADAAQREDAAHAMHALKGLAATISAKGLANWATEGEAALMRGERPAPDWCEAADGRLALAIEVLQEAQKRLAPRAQHEAEAARPPALDLAALREALRQGMNLLKDSDMDAVQFFEAQTPALRSLDAAGLEQLQAALAQLDFEAAAAQVQRMLERCA